MADLATMLAQGWQLHQSGRVAEAEAVYRQATRAAATSPEAWCYLGMACFDQRRFTEAVEAYERSLQLAPDSATILNNAGNAYNSLGRLTEAERCFRRAIRVSPAYATAYVNLAGLLLAHERPEDAVVACREAVRLTPDNAAAYGHLAAAWLKCGASEPAIQASWKSLRLNPSNLTAWRNLGAAYLRQLQFEEAVDCFNEALRRDPKDAESYNGLAVAANRRGLTSAAIEHYGKAVELAPDWAEAHRGLGIALLRNCEFERGWQEYEWRWRCDDRSPPALDSAAWDGSDLAGKRILLYAEQGLGDTINFIRYAGLLQKAAEQVIVVSPVSLLGLLESCSGIDLLASAAEPAPPHDVHAALLSVPRLLATDASTIPSTTPYLAAETARVEHWGNALPPAEYRIGIAWQGNRHADTDYMRSVPLWHFASLRDLEGIAWISLQKGDGVEQQSSVPYDFALHDLGPDFDGDGRAFCDAAAVMKHLDLFITCDSALAHVAGALGCPTWLLLSTAADWRWFLDRADTPWYPSMRIFRQRRPGDWAGVFQEVRQTLTQRSAADGSAPFAPSL